jgi:hypothetical protein
MLRVASDVLALALWAARGHRRSGRVGPRYSLPAANVPHLCWPQCVPDFDAARLHWGNLVLLTKKARAISRLSVTDKWDVERQGGAGRVDPDQTGWMVGASPFARGPLVSRHALNGGGDGFR